MNKTYIINKLIEHYKFETNADFAKFLGIKPQVLSNWKSRNTFDIELVFKKCPEINPEWLITGKGPKKKSLVKKSEVIAVEQHQKLQPKIPFFDLNDSLDLKSSSEISYVSLPEITSGDGVTKAVNDNMAPVLEVGDLLIYDLVPVDVKKIQFNKMYVLSIYIDENKTYKTIRYIHKSDLGPDFIKLVNEDKQYLDRNIEVNKIAALGYVKNIIKIA